MIFKQLFNLHGREWVRTLSRYLCASQRRWLRTQVARSTKGCQNGAISITIPAGTMSFDASAFEGCSCATVHRNDHSVHETSVGERVFYECDALTSVTIKDGVKFIGYKSFPLGRVGLRFRLGKHNNYSSPSVSGNATLAFELQGEYVDCRPRNT